MNQIQIQINRRRIEWLTHQNETLQAEIKEYESISDSAIKKSREFSQMQEEICSIANEVHQLGAGLNMISTLSHNIHSLLYGGTSMVAEENLKNTQGEVERKIEEAEEIISANNKEIERLQNEILILQNEEGSKDV